MDKETLDAITAATSFGIGALAGLINYFQRFTGDNPPPWRWKVAATKIGTGGFVALLTWFLLVDTVNRVHWLSFCEAIAGYGGAETIAFFQGVFQDVVRRATGAAAADDGQKG